VKLQHLRLNGSDVFNARLHQFYVKILELV